MARIYRIKTCEFKNLTNNKNLLTSTQKELLEKYEKLLSIKSKKFLYHGQDIVLIIGQDNKYYITGKKCYQDSIVKILESVKIPQDSIVLLNRSSNDSQDLSIAQLKNFLIDDDESDDESDDE